MYRPDKDVVPGRLTIGVPHGYTPKSVTFSINMSEPDSLTGKEDELLAVVHGPYVKVDDQEVLTSEFVLARAGGGRLNIVKRMSSPFNRKGRRARMQNYVFNLKDSELRGYSIHLGDNISALSKVITSQVQSSFSSKRDRWLVDPAVRKLVNESTSPYLGANESTVFKNPVAYDAAFQLLDIAGVDTKGLDAMRPTNKWRSIPASVIDKLPDLKSALNKATVSIQGIVTSNFKDHSMSNGLVDFPYALPMTTFGGDKNLILTRVVPGIRDANDY